MELVVIVAFMCADGIIMTMNDFLVVSSFVQAAPFVYQRHDEIFITYSRIWSLHANAKGQ